ncbi:MAG: thiamine biosynthesis protein ThiS [Thermofilum sp. ex4484_79]|mgnify:CR=1 FL=1|nr:MAG: thiamine biosynthesis protein ThiS [Thermofilum sp. ex4484_79]
MVDVVVDIFGREKRKLSVRKGIRIVSLLEMLNIIPEEVVVVVDGEITPEDERITRDCVIELLPVVSGG